MLYSRRPHGAAYVFLRTHAVSVMIPSQLQANTCCAAQTNMSLLCAAFCALCHKLGRDTAWRLRDSPCSHPYHLECRRIMQLLVLGQHAADWLVGRLGGPCVGHLPEYAV